MLTAWPIGISLGLLTQGDLADAYGWSWAMFATGVVALAALILTATLYRNPPGLERVHDQPLRITLPLRQFVHISIVGFAWTLYNVTLIIFVSFTPAVLVDHGFEPSIARSVTSLAMWAMLISIPFGGRLLEVFGWITTSTVVSLSAAAAVMVAVSLGIAPEALCVVFGLIAGVPAGALLALSAQALSADNRGTRPRDILHMVLRRDDCRDRCWPDGRVMSAAVPRLRSCSGPLYLPVWSYVLAYFACCKGHGQSRQIACAPDWRLADCVGGRGRGNVSLADMLGSWPVERFLNAQFSRS